MKRVARRCLWEFTICLLMPTFSGAQTHPIPLSNDANCLQCHADHATGLYVHPAVKRGCDTCHTIATKDNATNVELVQASGAVCRKCHQPEALLHSHFPYASGMCLKCHNPHTSTNPPLLRAKVNELCLNCHLQNRGKRPSAYVPTIELIANNSIGHPYARHPVSGSSDPLRGGEMSCISCHNAHGGTKVHYLRMGAEIPADALNENTETKDMCEKCHLRLWGMEGNYAAKRRRKKGN